MIVSVASVALVAIAVVAAAIIILILVFVRAKRKRAVQLQHNYEIPQLPTSKKNYCYPRHKGQERLYNTTVNVYI